MTRWRDAHFAVVDLETTGLDPRHDEVLSVGIVHIDGGAIRAGSAFYRVVRPQVMPRSETIVIHGIRPADLTQAPLAHEAVPAVTEALRGRDVVAHVASIEQEFLSRWLGHRAIHRDLIDTDALMRLHVLRERGTHIDGHVGLGPAAAWFGLPEHRRHHALGDALTTAQLFLALATHLGETTTVADLRHAERSLSKQARTRRRRRLLDRFGRPKDLNQPKGRKT